MALHADASKEYTPVVCDGELQAKNLEAKKVAKKRFLLTVLFPVIASSITFAIFAGYNLLTTIALRESTVNPMLFALIRDIIASACLVSIAVMFERKKPRELQRYIPDKEDVFRVCMSGFLCVVGCQAMGIFSIKYLSPALMGILTPLMPAYSISLAMFLGMEPFRKGHFLTWIKISGVAITFGGALLSVILEAMGEKSHSSDHNSDLSLGKIPQYPQFCLGGYCADPAILSALGVDTTQPSGGLTMSDDIFKVRNLWLGMFFLVLQILLCGSMGVVQKPLLVKYSPLWLSTWSYVIGSIPLFFFAIISIDGTSKDWDFNNRVLVGLFYAAFVASAISYFLLALITKYTSPAFASMFTPVKTIAVAVFMYLFNGTIISTGTMISGAIIFLGMFVTLWSRWKEDQDMLKLGLDFNLGLGKFNMEKGEGIREPLLADDTSSPLDVGTIAFEEDMNAPGYKGIV